MALSISDKIGQTFRTPDKQSTGLKNSHVIDEKIAVIFREKFDGMDILKDRSKIEAISGLINIVKIEHKKQIDTVIAIGRAFTRTENILTPSEWKKLLRYTQEILGMARNTASMYRTVAQAIDKGRLPRDLCPPSFSTAYALATLPELKLKNAIKNGKITPQMTRREVVVLKNKHSAKTQKKSNTNLFSQMPLKTLKAEQERLYKQLEAIENEIYIRYNQQKTDEK